MTIRIIVPLTWESDLRKELFQKLTELGYTWSAGDSLNIDRERFHNMAYIAIFITDPIVRFSSNIEIGKKLRDISWYNYFVSCPDVDGVIQSINFIKQYLSENPEEYKIKDFITNHCLFNDLLLSI